MYNYFGTGFMEQYSNFQALGLLSSDLHFKSLKEVFDYGISTGIHEHSDVTKLVKHSPFVGFIVKARGIFIKEFIKYQHCFPNCDVEACTSSNVFFVCLLNL